ncbi:MAG: right-handed parallel beta-helix repeat-containing protein [Reyranella sp.]|nr:right-handed parallel beta-helix repeat-containing protein [Reyranella sp.]MDP3161431.1 right-handed parallel beta-helix repeat-containing protein [Reyranella sp.]
MSNLPRRLLVALLALVLLPAAAAAQQQQQQQQPEPPRWFWSSGLGLYVMSINDVLAKDLGLERAHGGLVLAVVRGGAADLAGIKPGEIVSGWAPDQIWTEDGKAGTIKVLRDKRDQTIALTSRKVAEGADRNLIRAAVPARAPRKVAVDPSGKGDYRTVTAAMLRAVPGDEIVLGPGRYTEAAFLSPGVALRGTERALVRIEPKAIWLMVGPGEISLSRLTFNGRGVGFEGVDKVTVTDCTIAVPDKQTAIFASGVKSLAVSKSTVSGAADSIGLSAFGSGVAASDSVFGNHGTAAIRLFNGSRGTLRSNLLNGNWSGVLVSDSTVDAADNILTGKFNPDAKTDHNAYGFWLSKSGATLTRNVVRRHEYGYYVTAAARPVKIVEATATQGRWGIVLIGSAAEVSDSLLMQNLRDGFYVANPDKDPPAGPLTVSLTRSTVSGNGTRGINVQKFRSVILRENLVEANGTGVLIADSTGIVENNTIVLQRTTGIYVTGASDVELFNNIVAFNSYGLLLDVAAKRSTGFNDVYGNFASKSFPLRDGNYTRVDRYTTRDGEKVRVDVYPAYDLKADTDLSVDPGFVKSGTDYSLKPDSPLVRAAGRNRKYLGAYEPAP